LDGAAARTVRRGAGVTIETAALMRIAFRTDASVAQGTGHVMRCATLARALAESGDAVVFLCREGPGALDRWLEEAGFPVIRLAANPSASQQADADACRAALAEDTYDWLIVDHYELDAAWEEAMGDRASRILAIDDLGRRHECELLLDQNYPNPIQQRYPKQTPASCKILLGPRFAMIRPEFARLRPDSIARRRGHLSRILVFMGGSDPVDETTKALAGLARADVGPLAIDVVIGGTNPHRRRIASLCASMPKVTLHVQTPRMAELMMAADLALAAGGSATWERCTLGLPSTVTILASNQETIAKAVAAAGAQHLLGWHDKLTADDYGEALAVLDAEAIAGMSKKAAAICDGRGVERVIAVLRTPELCEIPADAAHV
jgi:UDP-2,4-diacetamido-2,4,6-trideoxy-beta-L-altropyranose hydrolase